MWWVYGVIILVVIAIGVLFATIYEKDYESKEQFKTLEVGFGRDKARQFVWLISLVLGIVLIPFSVIYLIKRSIRK